MKIFTAIINKRAVPVKAVLAVLLLLLIAPSAQAQRSWVTIGEFNMNYEPKLLPVDPGNGRWDSDHAPRGTFQIPSKGLLRVTRWQDPSHTNGGVNPNFGLLDMPRHGDGTMLCVGVYSETWPKPMADGVQSIWCSIGEVEPESAWLVVGPHIGFSGTGPVPQLGTNNRVRVEFSPGAPQPGEKFGPPSTGAKSAVIAEKELLTNSNSDGVSNGPTRKASFKLKSSYLITSIRAYHWNSGRGDAPGTLGLVDENGQQYGPWPAQGVTGSGVPNAYWEAAVNVVLPPGRYTISDSNNATWSHNGGSGGCGIFWLRGKPAQN